MTKQESFDLAREIAEWFLNHSAYEEVTVTEIPYFWLNATAKALRKGVESGYITENEGDALREYGKYWYPYITDDFGGYIDAYMEKQLAKTKVC